MTILVTGGAGPLVLTRMRTIVDVRQDGPGLPLHLPEAPVMAGIDGAKQLVVATSRTTHVFTSQGTQLRSFPIPTAAPTGLVVFSDGTLALAISGWT